MRKRWLITIFCWDGLLPAIPVICGWVVMALFPRGHRFGEGPQIIVGFVVPLTMAVIRASVAQRTLRPYFPDRLPVLRQIGLAMAIVMLVGVDVFLLVHAFSNSHEAIGIAGFFWVIYLLLMVASTFPPRHARTHQGSLGPSSRLAGSD